MISYTSGNLTCRTHDHFSWILATLTTFSLSIPSSLFYPLPPLLSLHPSLPLPPSHTHTCIHTYMYTSNNPLLSPGTQDPCHAYYSDSGKYRYSRWLRVIRLSSGRETELFWHQTINARKFQKATGNCLINPLLWVVQWNCPIPKFHTGVQLFGKLLSFSRAFSDWSNWKNCHRKIVNLQTTG